MSGRRRGLTLLEVIIAAFVFLLFVVFTSGLWIAYSRSVAKSRNHLVATHLGRTVLENAVDLGYNSVQSSGPLTLNMQLETDGVVHDVPFEYSLNVSQQAPGLKRVQVLVTYTYQGKTTEVDLETLITAQ